MAASSVAIASSRVSSDLRALIFASPVSARSSDVALVWHPGYRNRHKLRMLLAAVADIPVAATKGILRLLPQFRRFGYRVEGDVTNRLLVVPSECYSTPYVATQEGDAVYVFGSAGKAIQLRFSHDIVWPFFDLARAAAAGIVRVRGAAYDKALLGLMWISWVVSLHWVMHRALQQNLSSIVQRHGIIKLGSIHEMHAHSRIVWDTAASYGAKGYTVQHAAFSPGKRWLFPHPDELAAGLVLPQVFYVYDTRVAEMLRPYYPRTTFLFGHSHRFAKLRDSVAASQKGKYYLFATALPIFDNDVVISALNRLDGYPIRLRLHPDARLTTSARNSIKDVQISSGTSLEDDLQGAIAVIGLGSTVLQEALAAGRPVIQLTHPDFLEYLDIAGIPGVLRINHSDFSADTVDRAMRATVDRDEARNRFGFSYPEVTYERLFYNHGQEHKA